MTNRKEKMINAKAVLIICAFIQQAFIKHPLDLRERARYRQRHGNESNSDSVLQQIISYEEEGTMKNINQYTVRELSSIS